MDENKRMDEKDLENVAGGDSPEELEASSAFFLEFITRNGCTVCEERSSCFVFTPDIYAIVDTYRKFHDDPNCPKSPNRK